MGCSVSVGHVRPHPQPHPVLTQLLPQVRFGGRTGAAPLILGVGKLATGLLFGSTLLTLLQSFPQSLLGALLVFSGAAAVLSVLCLGASPACLPTRCRVWGAAPWCVSQ